MNLSLFLALVTNTVAVMLEALSGGLLVEGVNAVPWLLKLRHHSALPRFQHLSSSLAPPTLSCIFPTLDTLRAFVSAGQLIN